MIALISKMSNAYDIKSAQQLLLTSPHLQNPLSSKGRRVQDSCVFILRKILTFDVFLEVDIYQSQHANTSYCNTSIISVFSRYSASVISVG